MGARKRDRRLADVPIDDPRPWLIVTARNLLLAWDDLTPAQAARSLGISATAFRARLHRGRRRLGDRPARQAVVSIDKAPQPNWRQTA